MTGIMPTGGVTYENAFNTIANPVMAEGCKPTWHAPRCVPKFDPAAANAVISELLNAVNSQCLPYDCTRFDNLSKAISNHEISGRQTFQFDGNGPPTDVLNGTNRRLGGGSFTVPNTWLCPVRVAMFFESTVQFQLIGGDATSSLDVDVDVNATDDFSGAVLANLVMRVREWNAAGGDIQYANNPTSMRAGIVIPPGGREFFWRARSTSVGPGDWQLQYTEDALSVTVHGINSTTRDIF